MKMTYEEALNKINQECVYCRTSNSCAKDECIWYICKKAINKQISKKPILEADGYSDGELVYDTWICPNCDKSYEVDFDDYDFCPNCGQAVRLE